MKNISFLFSLFFLLLFLLIQKPLFSENINNPLDLGENFVSYLNEGTSGTLGDVGSDLGEILDLFIYNQPLGESVVNTLLLGDGLNSSGDIGNNSGETNTSSLQGEITDQFQENINNIFTPFLFIQELFPKDTSEFGEYIRIGSNQYFSGTIRIVGAGTSSSEKIISLEIQSNSFCVITDRPDLLVSGSLQCVINTPNMVLTDTGEPLEIWVGEQLHHKIIYSNSSPTQPLHDGGIINGSGYSIFSPSLPFYALSLFSQTQNSGTLLTGSVINTGTVGTGLYIYTGNTISTGNNGNASGGQIINTGENNNLPWTTGLLQQNTPFFIEEIYPFDEVYAEFIELTALQNRNGFITIQGLGQGLSSKTVYISTISGIKRVLTDNKNRFGGYPFVIELDSVSLTDGGEEIIVKIGSGQEIDKAVYLGQTEKKSWLFDAKNTTGNTLGEGEGYTGMELQQPTPGYSWPMIAPYFGTNSTDVGVQVPVCGIALQHEKPFYVTNKINLQAKVNNTLIQNNTTTYSCERSISGSDTMYLTGCNPSYLSFEMGIQPLILTIKKDNKALCSISSALNIPLEKNSLQTQTSNDSQQQQKPSYYEELYRKWKYRFEHLTSGVKKYGFTINSSGDILSAPEQEDIIISDLLISGNSPPILLINSILVNPQGKDALGEQIVIENVGLTGFLSDDIVLVKGKTTKGLPKGVLINAQTVTTLSGDLGLVNKPGCIQLRTRKDKIVLGWTCYPQLEEGEWFSGSLVGFTGKQEQERLQSIELIMKDNKACVWVGETQIACESLPYDPKEVAQRKKDAKKVTSINKKVVSLQEKYDLWREKYKKQSTINKKKEQTYLARNRTLREDISKQKKKTSRYRNFYWLMRDQLGKEFAPIFSSQSFQSLDSIYDTLEIYEEFDTFSLGPLEIPIQEVESVYNLYSHGLLPLERSNTQDVQKFINQGKSELNQFFKK